jgi:uncharacterized protein YdhG (YjbR/CyaY superfamily)
MNNGQKKNKSIDAYIASAPKQSQRHLRTLRSILKKAAPKATEGIKWRAPVFEESRILFAFYAYKDHLNFMPTPRALKRFATELKKFRTGKGSVSFPYDKPLPTGLIKKIAAYRVKDLRENDSRWM